jgi:hypothetical protein
MVRGRLIPQSGGIPTVARLSTIMAGLVAAAAILSVADTAGAAPGSRVCRQLEAELAGGGARPDAQARRIDSVIARQRRQIDTLRGQMRDGGCRSSIFGVTGGPSCKAAGNRVSDMERNLRALERQREQFADAQRRPRATVLAALDANDCRPRASREAARAPEESGLFSRLFGGRVERRERTDEEAVLRETRPAAGRSGPAGRVRTLCVRSCDGYFFPMSASSSTRDFARDQKNCEAACPGAAVEVFYHNLQSQESADMVSAASGKPYTQMPNAFAYKQGERAETCSCNRPQSYEVVGGREDAVRTSALAAQPAGPGSAGEAAAPPATVQSQGSFVTLSAPAAEAAEPPAAASEDEEEAELPPEREMDGRPVRVVGPVFLPDPEAAIDLRAPGRTAVP